jgi:hypothetical protein
MMAQAGSASRKTRIQAQNEGLILKAALEAYDRGEEGTPADIVFKRLMAKTEARRKSKA